LEFILQIGQNEAQNYSNKMKIDLKIQGEKNKKD
jgi:hypothetical protein